MTQLHLRVTGGHPKRHSPQPQSQPLLQHLVLPRNLLRLRQLCLPLHLHLRLARLASVAESQKSQQRLRATIATVAAIATVPLPQQVKPPLLLHAAEGRKHSSRLVSLLLQCHHLYPCGLVALPRHVCQLLLQ